MNEFILKKNLKNPGWYHASMVSYGEEDEQKEILCSCLFFLDYEETVIYSIDIKEEYKKQFWDFIERFLKRRLVDKVVFSSRSKEKYLVLFISFGFLNTSTMWDIKSQGMVSIFTKKYLYDDILSKAMIIGKRMSYLDAFKNIPDGYRFLRESEAEYVLRHYKISCDLKNKETSLVHDGNKEKVIILPSLGMKYSNFSAVISFDGAGAYFWIKGYEHKYNNTYIKYVSLRNFETEIKSCSTDGEMIGLYVKK